MKIRKALITGASEGIGRSLAKKLAKEHYLLTLVARNEKRLEDLLAELPSSDHKIVTADLSKPEDVKKISDLIARERYDILVNNAGHGHYGEFSQLPIEALQSVFRVNCEAVFMLSHSFLKNAQKGDALVNISSTVAFLSLPASATYAATKSFVTALSEATWLEEKKRGVYVLNVCPGYTRTKFFERAGGRIDNPPNFMFQTPEQVADETYAALQKRCDPTLITGVHNRIVVLITRLLSRKNIVRLLGVSR